MKSLIQGVWPPEVTWIQLTENKFEILPMMHSIARLPRNKKIPGSIPMRLHSSSAYQSEISIVLLTSLLYPVYQKKKKDKV